MLSQENISRTINNIRFPMMIGVVMIHCRIPSDNLVCNILQQLFSTLLPAACVPVFFLISGFLFFWNESIWNKKVFLNKFKRRFHSLVIPYVVWITLTIALFAGMHLFFPSMINPAFENVPEWGALQYLAAYWNGSGGYPISYPLWFLRNLIIMVFLTPLFYLVVYRLGLLRWIVLFFFCTFYVCKSSGSSTGLFYFYCGVLFSYMLNSKNIVFKDKSLKVASCVSTLIYVSLMLVFMMIDEKSLFCNTIFRLAGTVSFVTIFLNFAKIGVALPGWLGKCSFFIYLYHALPLMVLSRFTLKFIHPSNSFCWITLYFVNCLLVILIGIVLYLFLKRLFPRCLAVLCGGR